MSSAGKFFHRNAQILIGIGTGAVFGASIIPHTLGLSKYRTFLAQHNEGKEEPITDKINKLTDNVLQDIYLKAEEEVRLKFFTTFGHQLRHKGSVHLRTGAIIGVPSTFNYNSVLEVQLDKMQINNKPIDWESSAGNSLRAAVVLSDQAKQFAIAREVYYTNTQYVYVEAFLRTTFLFLAYGTGFAINRSLQLKQRMKLWGRLGLYGIIGSFYLFMYLTAVDTYKCHLDNYTDKKTAKLGVDYAKGGHEFYSKTLLRNQALLSIMGPEGAKMYTLYGNEAATWRRPHVQATTRKDNMLKFANNYNEKK